MNRILLIAAAACVLAVFPLLPGCDEQITGGPCQYRGFSGTATIRSVTPDPAANRDCENDVIIVFDFAPDDPGDVDLYRFPQWPDTGRVFELISGGSVPDGWAQKEGLVPDSRHKCIRSEIRIGTCTPLMFEFPDVDVSDWPDYCDKP